VWRNLLSLAICKPKIRSSAKKGDLIFGFGGKDFSERLIYIAKIHKRLENGDYYRKKQYSARPDCIYRDANGGAVRKKSARFHAESDQRQRDVGFKFGRAHVLTSKNFRYLGRKGDNKYKRQFRLIKRLVEGLKQGHRVNHSRTLRMQLLLLKRQVWRKYPYVKKVGMPTQKDEHALCNRDCGSVRCNGS
jgi:Nucleotide modification associated domain 2